ncbi:MAG: hypothetical protein ACLGI6_15530 [Gammaproteobacteria bacterium]
MDQHKLRTLVFEKTGVKIDVDDPVFALVALNEAVLEEAVERHVARIDAASAQLALAATGQPLPALPAAPSGQAGGVARPAPESGMIKAAALAAVLGAALVLIGQALWFRPPPVPASVVVARELTGEQALALQNAEKLNKIIAKLDAKTRNAIQAEMQKP